MQNSAQEAERIPAAAAEPPQEILTTHEAAALLRCSRQWLEGARVRGDGPPFTRLGRLVRYRRQVLLDYLARREVTSTSAEQPK